MTGSDKDRVTKPAADLSQFGERKFLNFNRFNDCHIHDDPLLRVMTSYLEEPRLPNRQPWGRVSRRSEHALRHG